jgi:DNA repair protein RadC
MTIDTLFGTEVIADKPRTIKLKQIKAVYETFTVKEDITNYLKTGQRYTAPAQVFETFSFLMNETKEMFISLHLDGKNRNIAMDLVSVGSLNQSIVHPREVFKTGRAKNRRLHLSCRRLFVFTPQQLPCQRPGYRHIPRHY